MKNSIVQLKEVISKLVPLLAGKGLQVTQRGARAYVEVDPKTQKPKVVNIPNVSENADDDFVRAVQGFIDHEVAHVLVSDWKYYGGGDLTQLQLADPAYQKLMNIHNIIEDTMIEKEIVKIFPGSKRNIGDLRSHFIEKVTKVAINGSQSSEETFSYLMVPAMRALAGHREFQEFMNDEGHWENASIKALVDAMGKGLIEQLETARTTKETLKISRELYKILYPNEPNPPEGCDSDDEDESESEDKPDQEAGEGNGDGERDHSNDNEEKDDEETEQDDPESEDEDGENGEGDSDDSEDEDDSSEKDSKEKAGDTDDGDEEEEPDDDAGKGDDAGRDDESGDDQDEDGGDDEGESGSSDGSEEGEDDGEDSSDSGSSSDEQDDGDDEGDSSSGSGDGDGDDDDSESGQDSGESGGEPSKSDSGLGAGGDSSLDGKQLEGAIDDSAPEKLNFVDENDKSSPGGGVGQGGGKSIFDFKEDVFEGASLEEKMSVIISDKAGEAIAASDWRVFSTEWDRVEVVDPPNHINDEWVPEMEQQVQSMTGRMQKDIERMMASQSHVIRTPGHKSGKMHSPSLWRVSQGDPRVFTQRQVHTSKDTAVELLIDNSGSMGGSKMYTAMLAAYALTTTLERVGIANEMIGFTTGGHWNQSNGLAKAMRDEYNARSANKIHWSRSNPIIMPIYKTFEERVNSTVKKRIAWSMNAQDGLGANIDGESLQITANRLVRRPEARKIVIVLSDGQPAGGVNCSGHLKGVVRDMPGLGIECIGIGINSDAVQQFYPNYVVLNKVEDLPGQVMSEIKKILM